MKRISSYFGLPMRILMGIAFLVWSGILLKSFVIPFFLENRLIGPLIFPLLMMIVADTFAIFTIFKNCDVCCDGKFLYVENLLKKDKIPVENIETYYIDFKGFNIVFREKTIFGGKIYFRPNSFEKKQIKKYLNTIIDKVEMNSMNTK